MTLRKKTAGSSSKDIDLLKETLIKQISETGSDTQKNINAELKDSRKENYDIASKNREELSKSINNFTDNIQARIAENAQLQQTINKDTNETVRKMVSSSENQMENIRKTLEERISALQESNIQKLEESKEKTNTTLADGLRDIRSTFDQKIQSFENKLDKLTTTNAEKMKGMTETLESTLGSLQKENGVKLEENKEKTSKTIRDGLQEVRNVFDQKIQSFEGKLEKLTSSNEGKMKDMTETLESNLTSLQKENGIKLEENKEKTSKTIKDGLQEIRNVFDQKIQSFEGKLEKLTSSNEDKMKTMTETLENKLNTLRQENSKKLEEMRLTVDEKLNSTLEQRLGEKFKLVSDRLEQVHNGLGEMKALATGVGDLKKVLTNVKTKGIWGEIQLGNILEEVLTTDQYVENVATKKNSNDRVEFAIKIPSKQDSDKFLYLPVDSKFPNEIYESLVEAQDSGNVGAVKESIKQLETRIKLEAKTIHDKYISPPDTTDFAVLFVPTESLYAEILKIQGLVEFLQNTYRVTVTGPTTMAAFLNSLQMGFRTLAIQKRSSEVWETLGKVKNEFGKFGDIIEKTKKKLQEASNNMDKVATRTRAIQRNLIKVEELPVEEKEFSELLE